MTPSQDSSRTQAPALQLATEQLAASTSARSVEIANDVLRFALDGGRQSLPIRAFPPQDYAHVSEHVLIAALRDRLDGDLSDAATGRIVVQADRDGILLKVTIELFVRYGQVLLDTARQARTLTDQVLADLLGATPTTVAVVVSDVHVSDVTRGDPHLVHPDDELL